MIINKTTVLLLAAFLLYSCGGEIEKKDIQVRPIKYQQIGYSFGEKIRTFSGTAKTDKIINLSFRNNGIITEHNLTIGQIVRKGQLLAKLDNVQSRLSYEQAITTLNSAASQMNTTKLNLNRIRALYEKGSSSLSEFESAKNSYRTAQESYQSAKRGVEIQKEQIRYGYLYAPENGTIASISAEIDENVSPGQTIAVLNSGTDMEISLGIPESVINGVRVDMRVKVDFPSIPETNFIANVTEVSPAVDINTSTYPVLVTVTNPSDEIKSGMAANVTFDFTNYSPENKQLVVPAYAVGEDSNGRFVFLVNEDGDKVKVVKHHITVGNLTPDGFEIKSGLSEGQKIAVAGLQNLLDGQEVKLK